MLKSILLFASSFLIISLSSYSQDASSTKDAARTKWIGGNVGYSSSSVKDGATASNFIVGPQYGMMFKDNLGGGVNLNFAFGTTKANDASNTTNKINSWEVVPYLRYYMGESNLKFFGDLYVGVGGTTTKVESDVDLANGEFTSSDFKVGLAPGMQYWFNDSWSVVSSIAVLEYKSAKTKSGEGAYAATPESTVSDFQLGVDFTRINFGLFYHF